MKRNAILKKTIQKTVYTAVCLALTMILPFFTGQIPQIGNALNPMHIPVFLCGFLCGWPYGMGVGFLAPIFRFAVFGMPVLMPTGIAMAFELSVYGGISGILYKKMPKGNGSIYLSLMLAMILGRIVWGIVSLILAGIQSAEFSFEMFITAAVINAVPGIMLHIVLIPIIVIALKKAGLVLNE